RERRAAPLTRQRPPHPLTLAELAEREWTSPRAITATIRQARLEIFGKDLSDSAIAYRLRLRHQQPELYQRHCAQPHCPTTLPPQASAARRYCDRHRTPAARVRRHRRAAAPGPGDSHPPG